MIKITEQEKLKVEEETDKIEVIYEDHNKKLKTVQEKIMLAREKRASASATEEGLQTEKEIYWNVLKAILNLMKPTCLIHLICLEKMFFQMLWSKRRLWMQKKEKEINLDQ